MKTKTKRRGSWKAGLITIVVAAFIASALAGCSNEANNEQVISNQDSNLNNPPEASNQDGKIKLEVPGSMATEHRELHEELEKAVNSGGKTGEAAKLVEKLLSVHFEKEEKYALPQLGLLPALSAGNVSAEMKPVIELSDNLKANLPEMLEEHKGIVEALNALSDAAKAENKAQGVAFAEKLAAHAKTEEQVMYPAAILVGEYLKLRLRP